MCHEVMLELMINFNVHIALLFIMNLNTVSLGMKYIREQILIKPGFSTKMLKPKCLIKKVESIKNKITVQHVQMLE